MKLQTQTGSANLFTKIPVIYFYVAALIFMLFMSWQYEREHSKAERKTHIEKVQSSKF